MSSYFELLKETRFSYQDWFFSDLRINIPPLSYGSDAANPHTQYSNAVARVYDRGLVGTGICFTLGEGNQFVCEAADYIVRQLDGYVVGNLIDSQAGLAETLMNPKQLRWLSPNAGLPMMAAGLVMNTLLDLVSKKAGIPAWIFLAGLDASELSQLVSFRHLTEDSKNSLLSSADRFGPKDVIRRTEELIRSGLPAYFTTWIGSSADQLAAEIKKVQAETGIRSYKVKIGLDFHAEKEKLDNLINLLPIGVDLAADANQKLDFTTATDWMSYLSERGFLWLEEPFAPDNSLLFSELALRRNAEGWQTEIATGENCPNLQVAEALLRAGLNRFQSDPCRMLGLPEGALAGLLTRDSGAKFTPHAGGAGLDELSPHLQLVYLSRFDFDLDPEQSLTETIGFCSHLYQNPTIVKNGKIQTPTTAGLIGGFAPEIEDSLIHFKDGVTWLEL